MNTLYNPSQLPYKNILYFSKEYSRYIRCWTFELSFLYSLPLLLDRKKIEKGKWILPPDPIDFSS